MKIIYWLICEPKWRFIYLKKLFIYIYYKYNTDRFTKVHIKTFVSLPFFFLLTTKNLMQVQKGKYRI